MEKQLQNDKPLTKYIIEGEEVYKPHYEIGYSENGKNPDPNSNLSKKGEGEGGEDPKGKRKVEKGDSLPTVESPPNSARWFHGDISIGRKICALVGANLRRLRVGLGLCPPVIFRPEKDNAKRTGRE